MDHQDWKPVVIHGKTVSRRLRPRVPTEKSQRLKSWIRRNWEPTKRCRSQSRRRFNKHEWQRVSKRKKIWPRLWVCPRTSSIHMKVGKPYQMYKSCKSYEGSWVLSCSGASSFKAPRTEYQYDWKLCP